MYARYFLSVVYPLSGSGQRAVTRRYLGFLMSGSGRFSPSVDSNVRRYSTRVSLMSWKWSKREYIEFMSETVSLYFVGIGDHPPSL